MQTTDTLTTAEVESTMDKYFQPDFNTFMGRVNIMAPYTSDIVSSFVSGLTEPLVGWQVYRSKSGESVLKKIAEVDKDVLSITDYLVANQTEYTYYVVPVTTGQLGVNLKSLPITTDWWNWCVMSIKNVGGNLYIPEEIWTFDNNLTSGTTTHNTDKTVYQTFSKYPKVSIGESDYIDGNITCLLGDVNCKTNTYDEPAKMMEDWRKFCLSEKDMILKDRKGHIYKIVITEDSSQFMDEIGLQPSTISFSYVQCGTLDDIVVYDYKKDI